MPGWEMYPALIRLGLQFCDDMPAFRRLMSEQAENARACRAEAPEVAAEIRRMCEEAKVRLEVAITREARQGHCHPTQLPEMKRAVEDAA